MSKYLGIPHERPIRDAAILTLAYVAGSIIQAEDYNLLGIEVDFTKGLLTSMEIKIEVSQDDINYFQQMTETVSGGVVTLEPGVYKIDTTGKHAFNIHPIRAKFIKISVKGTGTVTNSSCAIKAVLAIK
jgi:hypothetical protein